jgi:beta-barrel assembly-enhancing protease
MPSNFFKKISLIITTLVLTLSNTGQAQSGIPTLGDAHVTSLGQEYYMGRAWLMSFRGQAPVFSDPVLEDYIETLVYHLAATSQLNDRRLDIVLVDNISINAFAVPGGVVGIHSGLIKKAESEAQFSSVLTHELAHVSQRHFARGIDAQKKSRTASMIGLLGGLVAVAAGAGEAGMATMLGSQAAAQQSSLRYSRLHEQEADRFGIQNLAAAGFDPGGAAAMFEVMIADSRSYGSRPPEFLLTHPVTSSRVSDGKNRARQYPNRMYADNPEYHLMRMRVELSFQGEHDDAVGYFRRMRGKGGRHAEAAQYGLVLALTREGQYEEARKLLKPLRDFSPTSLTYKLAETDINIADGQFEPALALLQKELRLAPKNHPLTMGLATAYYQSGRYEQAEKLLLDHSRNKPNDPNVWFALSEVQRIAGHALGYHQSRAEYLYLNGNLGEAYRQLGYAFPMTEDQLTKLRIQQRMDYIRAVGNALGGR